MIDIVKLGAWFYGYCTDLIINLANLTNTSYYEVNAFFFCLLYPLLLILLITLYLIQRMRLKKIKRKFA